MTGSGVEPICTVLKDAGVLIAPSTWSTAGWDDPSACDQLWVADFSYVWTLSGFVYVAFVVDVFSRRILGWRVTASKQTPMVTDAWPS